MVGGKLHCWNCLCSLAVKKDSFVRVSFFFPLLSSEHLWMRVWLHTCPGFFLSKGHHVEMRILSVLVGSGASIDSHSWSEPGGILFARALRIWRTKKVSHVKTGTNAFLPSGGISTCLRTGHREISQEYILLSMLN